MNRSEMRRCVLIAGLLTFSIGAFAEGLAPRDSIGVEKIDGQSFIIHQVDERETLFGISRRYKTAVNEIVQNNDELKDGLKIGHRIKIPFVEKSAIPTGAKLHNVAPGETLFSIAQAYRVSVKDVMDWNSLQGNDLSVGQALVIEGAEETETAPPSEVATTADPNAGINAESKPQGQVKEEPTVKPAEPEQKASPAAPTTGVSTTGGWITHKVEQGQTLFAIARQYDTKVEDLIAWNDLVSNNLSLGQSLKVGRERNASVPVVSSPPPTVPTTTREPASSGPGGTSANTPSSTTYKNIKETGLAEVIEGTGNHKKYLALHRTAPVGTIMRIRNEENDVTVFARVVGVLPNIGDNGKLLVKVSRAAFDQLRAVNSRFPVEISY